MTSPIAPAAARPHLDAYRARFARRRKEVARLSSWESAIGWGRLLVFAAAVVLGWMVFKAGRVEGGWLAVLAGAFLALVVMHDRLIKARRRAERIAKLYDDGIARSEDRWPETDGRSQRFADEGHLYATDLDLFGAGSLFERLSVARTAMGEETLAAWLKGPAAVEVVRRRQEAVRDLGPRLDLREDMGVLGMDIRAEVNQASLASWAEAPDAPLARGIPFGLAGARVLAAVFGAAVTASLLAWLTGRASGLPFVGATLLAVGFVIRLKAIVDPVLVNVARRTGELRLLALLLARLEREQFETPLLAALRASLNATTDQRGRGQPASRRIARLARLVGLVEARRNQMVGILVAPLLWTTQLGLAVEGWRRAFGSAVAGWLAMVGETEALTSLATYAYEHPALPFPTISDGDEAGPRFDGEALTHPLLPAGACVPNDVVLGSDGSGPRPHLLLVSGSNMSGKSTLLRTVGANAVLALAGGPVCARRLALSRLALGATLRIHDSLQQGRSRFYAEITRLREIVDLCNGPVPVLFLIDEMLSGTNSHDRRIGAEAVLRALISRRAIGFATTHDLALAEIADAAGPAAANVHFEDEIRDGKIAFDYRMRPGVVRKSNALALMRAVGLDVGQDS
jgi:hypothetical protein